MERVVFLVVATSILLAATVSEAAKTCKDLHQAAFDNDLNTIKYLIETKKCPIDAPWTAKDATAPKYTALQVSLVFGSKVWTHPYDTKQVKVLNYLLNKKANVNIAFPDYAGITGYTLLHYAAFDGNMYLVPKLISRGAKVNARDQRGFTPLHSAARCDFRLSCDDCSANGKLTNARLWKLGAKPTISYLIKKGANILALTNEKETVLDIVPTPCTLPDSSCKEFGVSKCKDLCTAKGLKKTWPSGSCHDTYFFVKAKIAAKKG